MLSPNISSSNTISLLSLISYFNYKNDNKSLIYYLNSKVLKYLETQKGIESFIYIRNLYRAADFLNKESNIIYAKKYIEEIYLLSKNSKINLYAQRMLDQLRIENSSLIEEYINKFKNLYSNTKYLTNKKY